MKKISPLSPPGVIYLFIFYLLLKRDPTPELDEFVDTKWNPFTDETQEYLDIGSNLTASNSLKLNVMKFWEEIIHNNIKSDKKKMEDPELDTTQLLVHGW